MAREHINHTDLVRFAEARVNLPRENAKPYREQAGRLREKLQKHVSDHPDFTLKKILLSGSLAKGTSLRSLNDIDMACYISGADAPSDIAALLDYLADRLRKAFPNFSADQVQPQTYSVTVSFRGSGLDVDIVPVLYDGDPQWNGNLVSQVDGSLLATNIPRHLEFIRKRKSAHPHFAQVVRLLKQWANKEKAETDGFRFKSFMTELILAKLCDDGCDLTDYPEALQSFFTYVAKTGMRERIVFEDYYKASTVGSLSAPVQAIDPVNAENNVSELYTVADAAAIAEAAMNAGDAIDSALGARTKQDTVRYWQKIFGTMFQG